LATSDSSKSPTLETRTASILGTKFLDGLSYIAKDLNSAVNDDISNWKMEGLVSYSPASPHPSTARETQLFSINGRPVDLPNVSRVIGDVWKSFDSESGRRPACILAFTLPNYAFDVNLSPDKRQVMFTEEKSILGLIKEGITELWTKQSSGRFEANEVETKSNAEKAQVASVVSAQSKADVLNKITPKSNRKKIDEASIESSVADKLSSLAAKDNTFITPTVTETQAADSTNSNKENTNHTDCEIISKATENQSVSENIDIGYTKTSDGELKVWEQMKLSFNRANKSHQQKEITRLLSSGGSTDEEKSVSNYANSTTLATIDVSTNKRKRNTTNSIIERFTSNPNPAGTDAVNRRNDLNVENESTTEVSSHSSQRQAGETASETEVENYPIQLRSHASDKNSVGEECSKKTPRAGKESFSRRKAREEEIASKSGRMIVGKRIVSLKPNQLMRGRARKNDANTVTSSTDAIGSRSRRQKRDYNYADINMTEHKTVWNSFSGTQSITSQSRLGIMACRKRRKVLRKSLKQDDNVVESKEKDKPQSVIGLCREDFLHMSIVGQFNLGFIIARCRNHNLWILDQHACDERINFERLCKETVIHEQKLITPLQLELSPSEEHCVLEHMNVFSQNGFRFHYDPEKEPRSRLSLTALPHSGSGGDGTKAVQFGKEGERTLCYVLMLIYISTVFLFFFLHGQQYSF
jgi:DNA mismatch repair protein PMS2